MRVVFLLALLSCSEKPDPGSDTAISGGSSTEDTAGSQPADPPDPSSPPECAAPALVDGGRFEVEDLYASAAPTPPPVLASCGWGLAVLDLNEDDQVDVLLAGAYDATVALLNQSGVLQPSTSITFDDQYLPQGNGLAVGDLNGDQRPDIVLARSVGFADRVYFNQGGGRFASIELPDSEWESQTPSVLDVDNDGDLDIFVARHLDINEIDPVALGERTVRADPNRLYINDGGSFVVGPSVGLDDAATYQGAPFDADNDGDLDLFLVNDFGMFIEPNALMLNDGLGGFSEAEECGCDLAMFGMGASISDANNDAIPDIHITDFGSPRLLFGQGAGQFYDGALASGAFVEPSDDHVTSWGTNFIDLDMDGWDEIATVFGPVLMGIPGDWSDQSTDPSVAELDDSSVQSDMILGNDGGTFLDISEALSFTQDDVGRAIVTADLNGDGLPDMVTAGMTQALTPYVQVWNGAEGCGPGVTVAFPEMGARDIGSKVEWSVEGEERVRWFLPSTTFSSSGPTIHLGLGGRDSADWVRITPHGESSQEHLEVLAGTRIDQRSYQ